jgi:hypothetical protein
MTTDLHAALVALAEAFENEAHAHVAEHGGAVVVTSLHREAAQTRLVAERIRPLLSTPDTWEPDEDAVRHARAWLQSGMERVRVTQAMRLARVMRDLAL